MTSGISKPVNRSIIESKVTALADALCMTYIIEFDVQLIISCFVSPIIPTDSLSLFGILAEGFCLTEICLKIDLRNFQSFYDKMETKVVFYIKIGFNSADSLTKIMNNCTLLPFFESSVFDHPFQQ